MKLWCITQRTKAADHVDRCGVWPLCTGLDDPFLPACIWHDQQYVLKEQGEQTRSRADVDREFYGRCLDIAGDNRALRLRAYTFWAIVRSIGWMFW